MARLAICLETPAAEEVNFSVLPPAGRQTRQVLGTVPEAQRELMRRSKAFPLVPPRLRARGVPVVGRTGALLNRLLRDAGIVRDETLFLANSLRCFPLTSAKGDNYPTGPDKAIAQHACRQYDRFGRNGFDPEIIVITMHPAALFKEGASSAEPLILADLEKAACFMREGYRVLVLMGGHAAETFLGFGSSVGRWRGHYEWTQPDMYNWYARRVARLGEKAAKARRSLREKPPKAKKGWTIHCELCDALPKQKCECEGGWVMREKPKKVTKAEQARQELAARIVAALVSDLATGMSLPAEEEDALRAAWAPIVSELLAPPKRAKKAKDETIPE